MLIHRPVITVTGEELCSSISFYLHLYIYVFFNYILKYEAGVVIFFLNGNKSREKIKTNSVCSSYSTQEVTFENRSQIYEIDFLKQLGTVAFNQSLLKQ